MINIEDDRHALIWFKKITFQFQDIVKDKNLFNDYMKLHEIKTSVYSIPDGELTKSFIVKEFEIKFSKTNTLEIREFLRQLQLEYLIH